MANREEQIKTKKNQIFLGQQCFQVYSFKFNLAPRVLPGRLTKHTSSHSPQILLFLGNKIRK